MTVWLVLKFLAVGFLRLSIFRLFQGARRVIACNTLMFFHLAQEGKILEGKCFWSSAPNLKDISYKIDSPEPWTGFVFSISCSRVHKTVASFVLKVGLI